MHCHSRRSSIEKGKHFLKHITKKDFLAVVAALAVSNVMLPCTNVSAATIEQKAQYAWRYYNTFNLNYDYHDQMEYTEEEKNLYRYLAVRFNNIAAGTAKQYADGIMPYISTTVRVPASYLQGISMQFLSEWDITKQLTRDFPYASYWVDGYSADYSEDSLTVHFEVLPEFSIYNKKGTTKLSPARVEAVKVALNNAKVIAKRHEYEEDIQKLESLRKEVINLTEYDHAAADSIGTGTITSLLPWSWVSVFDCNPETGSVCEGYAQAFNMLVDISDFDDPTIKARLVTGTITLDGETGNHEWNIVTVGGKNYLTDITNSDTLFVRGVVGNPEEGYSVPVISTDTYAPETKYVTYKYDEDTKKRYGTKESALSK